MTPYIEDALQEVTVATAGVSAEYGRFSGGIANAVTKSGGNTFSGSFRTSFANDELALLHAVRDRRSSSPDPTAEVEGRQDRADLRGDVRRAGLEGPPVVLLADAPAAAGIDSARPLSTNIPYIRTNDEQRYEGKLTYTPRPGHSVRGSFLYMDQVLENSTSSNVDGSRRA